MSPGAIISPLSDLVGATDTIVGRLREEAKNKDARLRERDDLRDALLDLLHLLRQWEACAEVTNALVMWVKRDGTLAPHGDLASNPQLRRAVRDQAASADGMLARFGIPVAGVDESTRAAKGSIADVLFVYAPEAEEQLTRAFLQRRTAIVELRSALEAASADEHVLQRALAALLGREKDAPLKMSGQDRQQLVTTAAELRQAATTLAVFIREVYSADQTRVRGPR